MKKLCFGTLFTLLYQARTTNQNKLYAALVTPTDTSDIEPDKGSVGARKAGNDDIPVTEKNYFNNVTTTLDSIVALYRGKLASFLNSNLLKNIVAALKEILKEDSTIGENDEFGSREYTKSSILNGDTFDFFYLIASLMKYCSSINNMGYVDNIKDIPSDYISSLSDKAVNIHLETHELLIKTSIDMTTDPSSFSNVFTEVNAGSYSLTLPNPNRVKIFRLKVSANEFKTNGLIEFIVDNIGSYVYSRSKRKDFDSKGKVKNITFKAVNELRNSKNFSNSADNFSQIMLYCFLESSMNAPKIFSSFEIKNISGIETKSSGVYLLPAGSVSANNQIVFGSSKVLNNFKDAVDDVMNQAKEIKDNKVNEMKLLDPYILRNSYSTEQTEYIKSVVMPRESDDMTEPDDAFGIFISYSIDIPNKDAIPQNQYKVEVEKKMDTDIQNAIPYIQQKINDLGLSAYSFYLFVLPLDHAEVDAEKILESSINGGD